LDNITKAAEYLVKKYKLISAHSYDFYRRDYDNKIELIGLVNDPNFDPRDFENRELLFPKRWLTLGVFDESEVVPS
jgi:hypothetical protein